MKVKLLKRIRNEANRNLGFYGSWSGYFFTYIFGKRYEGDIVSGFKYVVGDTGTFLQDSILDYIHKKYKCPKTKKNATEKESNR
jgi:hypothetical protein